VRFNLIESIAGGDLIGDLASLLQQPHAVGVSETGQSFDYDVAIIGGGSAGMPEPVLLQTQV